MNLQDLQKKLVNGRKPEKTLVSSLFSTVLVFAIIYFIGYRDPLGPLMGRRGFEILDAFVIYYLLATAWAILNIAQQRVRSWELSSDIPKAPENPAVKNLSTSDSIRMKILIAVIVVVAFFAAAKWIFDNEGTPIYNFLNRIDDSIGEELGESN